MTKKLPTTGRCILDGYFDDDDNEPDPNGAFIIRRMPPKPAATLEREEQFDTWYREKRYARFTHPANACKTAACKGFIEWQENEDGGPGTIIGHCQTCNADADPTAYPITEGTNWLWYNQLAEDTVEDRWGEEEEPRTAEQMAEVETEEAEFDTWQAANYPGTVRDTTTGAQY